MQSWLPTQQSIFQSTRLSRASTNGPGSQQYNKINFNPQGSREPRRIEDIDNNLTAFISIHKALASLDFFAFLHDRGYINFNPQGSREPRPEGEPEEDKAVNFNPQGSREPRRNKSIPYPGWMDFNPQGSREPRRSYIHNSSNQNKFQSTRLSRASTAKLSKPAPHPP